MGLESGFISWIKRRKPKEEHRVVSDDSTGPPRRSWDYTVIAKGNSRATGDYSLSFCNGAVTENHRGRPIIERDSPINGGVYFTGFGEDCVVDDTKDQYLSEVYERLTLDLSQTEQQGETIGILENVLTVVVNNMPYDQHNVDKLAIQYGKNAKIILGAFRNGGVCRHQALLGAYLIERMIKEHLIEGKISVDRNRTDVEGHAWIRFTQNEKVYILDPHPAMGKVLILDKNVTDPYHWSLYARPEEQ